VIQPGQWVWYYYPRRYTQRSQKWQRFYIGPLLVVKQLGAVNFVIQKSAKATPMVVHIDKLKLCRGETPKSWLTGLGAKETRLNNEAGEPMPGDATPFDAPLLRDQDRTVTPDAGEILTESADAKGSRPMRSRRPPNV
jgi:hypothetical protein